MSEEIGDGAITSRPETNFEKFGNGRKPDAVKSLMMEGWLDGVKRLNQEIKNPETPTDRVKELLEWFHKWTMLKDPEPQAAAGAQPTGPTVAGLQPYGVNFIAFQAPAPRELPAQTVATAPVVPEEPKTQA